MMRSLWAGVTGLQAHQIAMDVEGNNIANVNTIGFKYSRANFSDLLSQTAKIATAPQGELGGKNSMQIGLGTQVSSVTKIFKQGSIETTDKNTDLAIQGDGFFVVSPDGGSTYKYTRNGDFSFDALGNFTESNGYIIQGWMRDDATGEIDATAPIRNITIPPGLTTPANDTGYITLKANLNSGNNVGTSKTAIYALDSFNNWYDRDDDKTMLNTEEHDENDVADDVFDTEGNLIERGMDFGALFNASGEAFNLRDGQGVWVSYTEARTQAQTITAQAGENKINLTINGEVVEGTITPPAVGSGITQTDRDNQLASYVAQLINQKSSITGVEAQLEGGNRLVLVNNNKSGTEAKMKNIDFQVNSANTGFGVYDASIITSFQYTYSSTSIPANHNDRVGRRTFTTTEDLRAAMQEDARVWTDYLGNGWNTTTEQLSNVNDGVKVIVNAQGQFEIQNPTGDAFNAEDGDVWDTTLTTPMQISTGNTYLNSGLTLPIGNDPLVGPLYLSSSITYNGSTLAAGYHNAAAVLAVFPAATLVEEVTIPAGSVLNLGAYAAPAAGGNTGPLVIDGGTGSITTGAAADDDITISGPITLPAGSTFNIPQNYVAYLNGVQIDTSAVGGVTLGSATSTQAQVFDLSINLADGGQVVTFPSGTVIAGGLTTLAGVTNNPTIGGTGTVYSNDNAMTLELSTLANYTSVDDHDMFVSVTGLTNALNEISLNSNFATSMGALQGALTSGTAVRTSQNIYAANHASSIDVYDSLGSKHTVRFEFTKTGYTDDGGTEWSMLISVPEPGVINPGSNPENIVTGTISFNSDGSLASFNPTNLTYTANNGSTPNQNIELQFGTLGQFDGMTSFDAKSNTSGISQDGYPGGDLAGIRVDETGTLIGSFTNGRSFGLAQVAMAKFTNNEGLESDGGNTFIQTSNSGDPVIGQAAVGGRGFVQASSLEMSNVDLSRSLTQLIVIQRGYQANSKTITTSDQMLNTLLQLKQ